MSRPKGSKNSKKQEVVNHESIGAGVPEGLTDEIIQNLEAENQFLKKENDLLKKALETERQKYRKLFKRLQEKENSLSD